jgi:hypothetical protein
MVNLISECKSFCDYGMKQEVLVPLNIYDDFVASMDKIMVLFVMSEYRLVCNKVSQQDSHYLKLFINDALAFTFIIKNHIDKHYSMFNLSILYHFHNDKSNLMKYRKIIEEKFSGLCDGNMINLETEEDIIAGLDKFLQII